MTGPALPHPPRLDPNSPSIGSQGAYSTLEDAFRAICDGLHVDDEELRRLAMEGQGSQEIEFCFGEESESSLHSERCTKNPGHKNFILLQDFGLKHFPEGYRNSEYLDIIHCQAALTVKLTTYYQYVEAPVMFPMKAELMTSRSYATGFVLSATPMRSGGPEDDGKEEEEQGGPLTQPGHSSSGDDHAEREIYRLEILTATHAVFNKVVANKVGIEFSYFDDSHTLKTVKSEAKPFFHSDFGGDFSTLTHYTEDKELCLKLQKCLHQIHHDFLIRNPPSEWVPIVSHPHGKEKHVSLGKIHHADSNLNMGPLDGPIIPWLENFPPVRYTTATCPGSSGARVFLWSMQQRLIIFAHRCRQDDDPMYNKSARGFRYHDLLEWSKTGLHPIIKQ